MKLHKALRWFPALVLVAGCNKPVPAGPQPQLTAVAVSCTPTSVVQRSLATCTASATDQNGEPFTGASYTWKSSDERVAKVDAQGSATTTTVGTVTITATATANGVTQTGQASLTVTAHPPTNHSANITSNETWSAADNPHVVHGQLEVNGASAPVTLTLNAGVEVHFDADAELSVKNGALKAQGTHELPIQLVANQDAPSKGFWHGLVFTSQAGASLLEFVTLSHCGPLAGEWSCLAVVDNKTLTVLDVTVRNSFFVGVWLKGSSQFTLDSARVSAFDGDDFPLAVSANQAGTLPKGGTFSGNQPDGIAINRNGTESGIINQTQTWPNLGIPYYTYVPLSVEGTTASASTLLTLSSGITFFFGPDGALDVATDASNFPADLIVDGTDTAPVRFTAANDFLPGQWKGVHLGAHITSASRISHALFEYAGASSPDHEAGNLNVYGSVLCKGCPALDHLTVQKSSSYGMTLADGQFASGTAQLTLRDNGGYPLKAAAGIVGTTLAGATLSGNTQNAVVVTGGNVTTSQTWPNLGAPYLITQNFDVGAATTPTLTLAAGVELRFDKDTALTVGNDASRPGALVAVGTAAAPIRFVPNTTTPTTGFWDGVQLVHGTGHKIDHALFSYAGGGTFILHGNLNVYQERGGFVTNSTFSNGAACGIMTTSGFGGYETVTTDFTQPMYNNSFNDNGGGPSCDY